MITLAVIVIMLLRMMMFLITAMLLLIMIFIYMQICTWIDSRNHDSSSASWSSASATSAAWTRACDPKSFVKFVCEQASGNYCDASCFDDGCVTDDGMLSMIDQPCIMTRSVLQVAVRIMQQRDALVGGSDMQVMTMLIFATLHG